MVVELTTLLLFFTQWKLQNISSGLYYKHETIVNYTSSGVNNLKASLNDDTRVVIYDRHMFIVQATGLMLPPGGRNGELFCPHTTSTVNVISLHCEQIVAVFIGSSAIFVWPKLETLTIKFLA